MRDNIAGTLATVMDVRMFVPARDFAVSKAFYRGLGWKLNWEDAELAEMKIADRRFLLQNAYVKQWAENFMIHISVNDAQAWFALVTRLVDTGKYLDARVALPERQAYGALVTHVWDPSGVLLHLAQWDSG